VSSLEGDAHRGRRRHGGADRTLCLFSHERIAALRAEGHPITPGSIGENLTIAGVDWTEVTPGTCLLLGPEVMAQVMDFTSPCATITGSFHDRARVSHRRHPGHRRVYARVLREGTVTNGDPVRLLAPETARTLVSPR
jgi:MOSC domain-containing protein YiiM